MRLIAARNRGFFGKLVVSLFLVLGASWALLNFVVTATASDIAKNLTKYDNKTAYLMGKIVQIGYFPDANVPAYELSTRMGNIWIGSLKDLPDVGSHLFMEAQIYCTPESYWSRFSEEVKQNPDALQRFKKIKYVQCEIGDHKRRKSGSAAKLSQVNFPVAYEMTRLRMPF